jgi:hypothetical protein
VGDPLESARLKVDRANSHARALKAEIERWLEDDPYSLTVDEDSETGEEVCVIHIARRPPIEWSLIIGEIVYGLRSALDHAVFALSTPAGGGSPPRGTEFPIFIDKPKFPSTDRPGGLWKIRGLGDVARKGIEAIQPFNSTGEDPRAHPFWVLQELCNSDKHRLLNMTGGIFGASQLDLRTSGDLRIERIEVRGDGPVEDGDALARWRFLGGKGQVTLDGDIAYDVAFDQAGPAKGERVGNGIDILGTAVNSTIATLAKTV